MVEVDESLCDSSSVIKYSNFNLSDDVAVAPTQSACALAAATAAVGPGVVKETAFAGFAGCRRLFKRSLWFSIGPSEVYSMAFSKFGTHE